MSPLLVDNPFEVDRLNDAGEFEPDWDVASIGGVASEAISSLVDAVRASPAPNGGRKIHVLLGPAGYGKTHLFGRVLHKQKGQVQFVYVPMTSDPARIAPAEHIRYQVVESLFNSPGDEYAPIRKHLTQLIAPSFAAYFDQLPGSLQAKVAQIRRRLDTDPHAVFEILGPADTTGPYSHLADSVRHRFPGVPAAALRALVLALSPAADDARTWLRGEAGTLTEERLRELLLTELPPDPTGLLKSVATLLQELDTPILLCLDQLELLLRSDRTAFGDLSIALMAWLQEVPNLILVLGCLTDKWRILTAENEAFRDRTQVWHLDQLTVDQAEELIVRRMRSWSESSNGRPRGWPFDLPSVRVLVNQTSANPRGLLQKCRLKFEEWDLKGRMDVIKLGDGERVIDEDAEFLREWNATLEKASRDIKAAAHYSLDQLQEGIKLAITVAGIGEHLPEGIKFEKQTWTTLKQVGSLSYPMGQIDLILGSRRLPIVVTVGKPIENGQGFNGWFNAFDSATKPPVTGAVAVWSVAKPFSGKQSKGWVDYRKRLDAQSVRAFPLDENADAFRHLEALRMFIDLARGQNLRIADRTISEGDCLQRLARTKVLANLKLIEVLFRNWPALSSSPSASSETRPSVPPPPSARGLFDGLAKAETGLKTEAAPAPATTALLPPPVEEPLHSTAVVQTEGEAWAQRMLETVVQKLRGKGQSVRPGGFELGPTFARLRVEPKDDTDFAKVKRQADNLKLHLALEQKPLIANQAGYISVDIQRPDRQTVTLEPLLANRPKEFVGQPAFVAGVDVTGKPHWLNLADHDTCHLLVAGTTGSGKSEFLKSMIGGLCEHLSPEQLKLFLIDPKQVTFSLPGQSPYLAGPVVYDASEAIPVIERCCEEMERRYTLLRARGKDNIGDLIGEDSVPRWVVVFDEFADLMADKGGKKELEKGLKRLGAKARAAGIHLVLGTQRPEASVVTPLLRSNLPGRISLRVISEKDSKLILPDQPDAAYLLGRGDMFWWYRGGLLRLQSPYLPREELARRLKTA